MLQIALTDTRIIYIYIEIFLSTFLFLFCYCWNSSGNLHRFKCNLNYYCCCCFSNWFALLWRPLCFQAGPHNAGRSTIPARYKRRTASSSARLAYSAHIAVSSGFRQCKLSNQQSHTHTHTYIHTYTHRLHSPATNRTYNSQFMLFSSRVNCILKQKLPSFCFLCAKGVSSTA